MIATFNSLRIPNYRRYFSGALTSNIGSWVGRTAISWLVQMELTDGNASALGFVTAIMFTPQLLLAAYAGSIADRFPKRRVLLVTQSVLAFDSLILAVLVLTGHAQLWMVYLLALSDGLASTFDNPARQAFVSEVVPFGNLPNAIGLNSASFNAARLLGPGIAGLLIGMVGTGVALALDSLSYLVMITCLASLDQKALHPAAAVSGPGKTREGLRYARSRPDLMILLACGFAVGGLGFNYQISNAVMSTQLFGRGPGGFGIVGSAMGLGALAAALWAAGRKRPRLRFVLGGMAGYVVFNLLAAFAPNFIWFVGWQIPAGFATITVLVTGNTMLQSATSPQMRGRVLALWGLMIFGVTPLISPVVGWLGDHLGPQSTVLFGVVAVGISLLIITWLIMHNDQLHVRFDRRHKGWLRLERGSLGADVDDGPAR